MTRPFALLAALALLLAVPATALAGAKEEAKAADAARVLGEIMRIPETAVPEKMFTDAHAIAVIPDVVKAGLIFGGRGGKGLISVRSPDGTWSNPSFIKLGGGSVGFQAGVSSSVLAGGSVTRSSALTSRRSPRPMLPVISRVGSVWWTSLRPRS